MHAVKVHVRAILLSFSLEQRRGRQAKIVLLSVPSRGKLPLVFVLMTIVTETKSEERLKKLDSSLQSIVRANLPLGIHVPVKTVYVEKSIRLGRFL